MVSLMEAHQSCKHWVPGQVPISEQFRVRSLVFNGKEEIFSKKKSPKTVFVVVEDVLFAFCILVLCFTSL